MKTTPLINTKPKRHAQWLVLIVGMILTIIITFYVKSYEDKMEESHFLTTCNEIQDKILEQFNDYIRLLKSLTSVFNISKTITRKEWRLLTSSRHLENDFPGFQGIGFSIIIHPKELARHILEIRKEGFPNYTLRPEGNRDIYSSIIYLEPFSGSNLRAFGYDMYSEPIRRAAMERARDMNTITVSGKVNLVQDFGKALTSAVLIYAPVYKPNMLIKTVEERRAAIYGLVYSPYRILPLKENKLEGNIHLQIFDEEESSGKNLLYESDSRQADKAWSTMHYIKKVPIEIKGHHWNFVFTKLQMDSYFQHHKMTSSVMIMGLLITIIVFLLIRARINTHLAPFLKAEQEYQVIISTINEGFWRINEKKQTTFVNSRMADMLEYSSEEMLGLPIDSFLFSEDLELHVKHMEKMCMGHSEIYEQRYRKKNGQELWSLTSLRSEMNNVGKFQGAFALITDITDRKYSEKKLIESGIYSRSLIEASIDPLVTINRNGKITDVNQAAILITGGPKEKLIGNDFSYFFSDPLKANNAYETVFNKGFLRNYPLEIKHEDGHLTPVLYNASVYRDANGKIEGVLATARDMSELKKAEEELKQLNAELEQRIINRTAELLASNKELERFAYIASHDLQTPLRHIMAYTDIILEKTKKTQIDITEEAKILKFGIDRMRNLIMSLLSYSRVGRTEITKEEVDLNLVIKEVLNIMGTNIKERSAEITVPPFMESVYGNKVLLPQLFQNLLENAIKFCPKDRHPKVQIFYYSEGSYLQISIKDNGVGIDTEFYESVFEIFQKLNRQEDFEGTGIGLSICKKIVENHGGKIWLTSKKNEGTIFSFTLPKFQEILKSKEQV